MYMMATIADDVDDQDAAMLRRRANAVGAGLKVPLPCADFALTAHDEETQVREAERSRTDDVGCVAHEIGVTTCNLVSGRAETLFHMKNNDGRSFDSDQEVAAHHGLAGATRDTMVLSHFGCEGARARAASAVSARGPIRARALTRSRGRAARFARAASRARALARRSRARRGGGTVVARMRS